MSGFLDTSMLVRYLTNDPPDLAQVATEIIDEAVELFVSGVLLTETAHVLMSYYAMPRAAIVDALIALLRRDNVVTVDLNKELAIEGLELCRPSGRVSFPDALIWAAARSHHVSVIYSLDARFPKEAVELRSRLSRG